MSFFDLSDGSKAEKAASFESGNAFEPIPDKTKVLAMIETAEWKKTFDGDDVIEIKWRVLEPEIYKNRIVFDKLKVFGTEKCRDKQATADKAKRKLAAIDTNAGGGLLALGRKPENTDLMKHLNTARMCLMVMVYEFDDGNKGNWVSSVSPADEIKQQAQAPRPAQAAVDLHDDIPW